MNQHLKRDYQMFLQMLTTLPLQYNGQYNDLTHDTVPCQDSRHTIEIIIAIRCAVVG